MCRACSTCGGRSAHRFIKHSEEDEGGAVGEEGRKVPRLPSGIDQSFEIDLLKWFVNTDAQSPGE
jgi:hypothetical protein